MKRLGTFGAAVGAMLVMATPAQAAPISTEYCNISLRGGGSLAPDNDIKAFWDKFERDTGRNIAYSVSSSWVRHREQHVSGLYSFYNSANQLLTSNRFHCWRSGFSSLGTYHDDNLPPVG